MAVLLVNVAREPGPRPAKVMAAEQDANLVKNGGFEEGGDPVPAQWNLEEATSRKGSVSLTSSGVHSGRFALKLVPNRQNGGDQPLGLSQGVPAAALHGRRISVSAWMSAEGGAVAVVGLFGLHKNGQSGAGVQLRATERGMVRSEDSFEVDRDSDILILYCVVVGTQGAAIFDDIVVTMQAPAVGGAGPGPADSTPLAAAIVVDAGEAIRTIPRTLYGASISWYWNGNGIWDGNIGSLNPEVARLSQELNISLLRFPGSDFYHWKDGVGPRGSRRETAHDPDGDRSVPNFGTDEVLAFAERIGADVLLTVNASTGTAEDAAAWVRYVNDRPGARRVEYWEVGNEPYINDGSKVSKVSTIPPAVYADRFLRFARLMREADPTIKIGAVGGENYGRYQVISYPNWNKEVLATVAKELDFLAVHNAYAPVLDADSAPDLRTVYAAMLAAPVLMAQNLATLSRQIDSLVPDRSSQVKIAVTEWGPLFSGEPRSRYVDHVKTLGSALYAASAMKAFLESPRTEIANLFTLVDIGFMGWIGVRGGQFVPKAPYLALQMYTRHFGSILLRSSTTSPTYDSAPLVMVEAVRGVPYLDVVASRSEDGGTLHLIAINKNFDRPIRTSIRLLSFEPEKNGIAWTLNGTGIDANTGTELPFPEVMKWARQAEAESNPRLYLGKPDEVRIVSTGLDNVAGNFEYTFPPHSVTSLELRTADARLSRSPGQSTGVGRSKRPASPRQGAQPLNPWVVTGVETCMRSTDGMGRWITGATPGGGRTPAGLAGWDAP